MSQQACLPLKGRNIKRLEASENLSSTHNLPLSTLSSMSASDYLSAVHLEARNLPSVHRSSRPVPPPPRRERREEGLSSCLPLLLSPDEELDGCPEELLPRESDWIDRTLRNFSRLRRCVEKSREGARWAERSRVCVEAQEGVLREADRRRRLREEEVRLRQEQDREFQQTLLADQLREAERLEAESISRNSVLRKQNTLAAARALLKTEPNCSESNVAKLRLTLPSGKKVDRRFYSNETLEHVQAFLRIYIEENGVNIENFSMSSSFPKRTFEDTSVTIDEAGLSPMAVIMVQDLDA